MNIPNSLLTLKDIRLSNTFDSEKEINLDLYEGEVLTIMGESGSGKTGIVEILTGKRIPVKGSVYLNGKQVEVKSPRHASMMRLGVLLKDTFIPHIRIKDYLFLSEEGFLYSRKKQHNLARSLFDEYEIDLEPNRYLIQLNPEEFRLVSIMKLIAQKPNVLVLDEPALGLSESKKSHLFMIIGRYIRKENAVLYLTNHLDEILQVGHRVTILKDGGIVGCYSAEYAKKNPGNILNLYFGNNNVGYFAEDEFKTVINTMLHTTKLLTSEYELQDLLDLLTKNIEKTVKVDSCNILLLNEDPNEAAHYYNHSRNRKMELRLKEEFVLEVIQSGSPYVVNDINALNYEKYFLKEESIEAFACIPVSIRPGMGGLIIAFKNIGEFFPEEVDVLLAFSMQVAVAIENSRLLGRSTLLKEAHHRIKNNLQSIISLLILQKTQRPLRDLDVIIEDIIDRIMTISTIHEILSQDERSIGLINFKNLIDIIVGNYNSKKHRCQITIKVNIEDFFISYKKATSLGLIINELLANSYKHAFPERMEGEIEISLADGGDLVTLVFADNGVGFAQELLENSESLGFSLVKFFVNRDLRGSMVIDSHRGTNINISFPNHI